MKGAALKIMTATAMLGMAVLLLPAVASTPQAKPNPAVVVEASDDMTKGSETAPVTLIQYVSLTCSHCAAFNEEVMPQIEAKYVATGKVRYIQREYLTPPNDVAMAGILLARCAGKDKYFEVVDTIMRSQSIMFFGGTTTNVRPVLLRIAKDVGLSPEQFDACMVDLTAQTRVYTNADKYILEHHVRSTPTFFINGVEFKRKTGDFAEFERAFAAAGVK
ncbi:hypothetical protein ABAC460_04325 [Asticcacaulis sp. AC460]|uniref:thioredoxin domain-containing protein n=1 Tax=Asticcacaulis sp. AC460 TaxID=1282360 RepID=UPI0003C3F764|nr:thioredoxin domain-containing protein [Asticcacaulis sp. AC460]ESQ92118.1 hypothetical protein ABAC460_04325 [Asticcacaulis sp. AC460]